MKRMHPLIRALCERVRRPAVIQILVGLALTTPAGLMVLRDGRLANPVSVPNPIVLPALEVVAPTAESSATDAKEFADKFRIPTSLAVDIHEAATEAGVSPKIAFGLVRAESRFRPAAVSPVGAVGLTQLMPRTARWLAPGTTRQELKNPDTNLRIGFKYLRSLIDKYDGNEKLALTAFNRGPGTVDRLIKRGRNPDNGYAELVTTGKSSHHTKLMNRKFRRRS